MTKPDATHEIAKRIVEEHAWERASGGFYIDEVNFENLLIDIAEAIQDAESREPEKLNNAPAEQPFDHFVIGRLQRYGVKISSVLSLEALQGFMEDVRSEYLTRKYVAQAESSLKEEKK